MEIETLKSLLSFWRPIHKKLLWLSDCNGHLPSPLLFLYSCIDNVSYLVLSSGLNGLLRPKLAGLPTGMHWPYIPVNDGVLQLVQINNNSFISHSISPITTKLGSNVIQYTLVLVNRWWWHHQHWQTLMTLSLVLLAF